jgi:hypothetical protein
MAKTRVKKALTHRDISSTVNKRLDTFQRNIIDLSAGQKEILRRLDTVSANGNPGLEASLKDIYGKLTELHHDVMGIQDVEKSKWYNVTINELFRKKWMKPVWIVGGLLLVNTILFQFGVALDFQSILKALMGHN